MRLRGLPLRLNRALSADKSPGSPLVDLEELALPLVEFSAFLYSVSIAIEKWEYTCAHRHEV